MTLLHPFIAREALADVEFERAAQDARWGEQNHPDVPAAALPSVDVRYRHHLDAEWWKTINDARVESGNLAWDGVLLEEVYEALAESDPAKLRAELIQVAAVAVAWVEAIDRRTEAA